MKIVNYTPEEYDEKFPPTTQFAAHLLTLGWYLYWAWLAYRVVTHYTGTST